jgi:hypothetical protein
MALSRAQSIVRLVPVVPSGLKSDPPFQEMDYAAQASSPTSHCHCCGGPGHTD